MGKFDASAYRDIELILMVHGVYSPGLLNGSAVQNLIEGRLLVSPFTGYASEAHEVLNSYVDRGLLEAKRVREFMDHVHNLIH